MYFPYLRGRQYELISIRELVERNALSKKIIPVIEPVKLTPTLVKTLDYFDKREINLAVIWNPDVGSINEDLLTDKNKGLMEAYLKVIKDSKYLYSAVILDKEVNVDEFCQNHSTNILAICKNIDGYSNYTKLNNQTKIDYCLMTDETSLRHKINDNRVMLGDNFSKAEKNSAYIERIDEPFSENHLYYLQDGYVGFSDYSIVGEEYSETGFAPRAVAIHIVYFDENNALRIRHFVSDSNDDINDPAGKFKEALQKLIEWNKSMNLSTRAMNEFQRLYDNQLYPGLGVVKKLAIMHHLEIIGTYLNKE